ncbi:YopX family protein [Alkalibacillus salilacus]|uniref:Phage protein (TIGR01671 family) n=1 Tax=Alkalibacillus salilacus TaxID=284582 RepID=A0ABT9VCY1_9BACI|nr:YopX family protein [Alkalibacillus salilacus]MDQ0158830.1 putative phage protein (TIGR01671 family) [Alkalibacillus salilacus]
MRPIKFRAWVLNNHGDWMAQQGVHPEIDTPSKFLALYGENILMQYTGLQDKNGTEIYEGDIVQYERRNLGFALGFSDDDTLYYTERQVIKWLEQGFNVPQGFIRNLEVIGNIYQHPELLEGVADGS